MQKGLKMDGQMRALAIAMGGAIVTSVVSMFVPVGVFEAITGSTGISELVPATGAPLGDTARALIAFGFGVAAFAAIAAILLRKPASASPARPVAPVEAVTDTAQDDAPAFFERMKDRLTEFASKRRGSDAVTDLSDLPKLRAGDAHPDAPPRRPISAHRDFAELIPQAETPMAVEPEAVAEPDPVVEAPAAATPAELPAEEAVQPQAIDVATVAAMVDRLEAAVARRQESLNQLEALVLAEKSAAAEQAVIVEAAVPIEIEAPRQPVLEAVPDAPAKPASESDEMDAALRSALETLHRMNARTR